MQVLLALIDARGAVATRDDLAAQCWQGRFVADDSLNAAIAELRRALQTAGSDDLSIETIPKTGYRIVAPGFEGLVENVVEDGAPFNALRARRRALGVIAVGGAGLMVAAGLKFGRLRGSGGNEVGALVEQGRVSLRQGLPEAYAEAVQQLQRAVASDPDNADAWGLLALASREAAEYAEPTKGAMARRSAELAARRALEINPRQSDALTALALLAPVFGYWTDAERRIRAVLAIDPANGFARSALGTLQMSTGQVAKCLRNLNWLVQRDPWSPNHQFRRVYTLWSDGHLAEMDRAADWALQSWPSHPAVWFARFWTLTFTGRVGVATKMLRDTASRPPAPPRAWQLLERSLQAIARNAPAQRREAITQNVAASVQSPGSAITAIMILSQLGAANEAYQVARGFLLQRGELLTRQRHPQSTLPLTDQHHRMAMMLWIPVTAPLRMHPDFKMLCEGIGLVDYWRQAGIGPDFRKAWT